MRAKKLLYVGGGYAIHASPPGQFPQLV